MQTALETTDNPMDYNLQAVLPGVHNRLAANEHVTRQTLQHVQQLPTLSDMQSLLQNMMVGALSGLGNSQVLGGPPARAALPNNATLDNNPETRRAPEHLLSSSPERSIQSFYDEWFGLNEFKDKPIDGGIAELEKKFKTSWRGKNDWSRISRQKRLCIAVEKEAKASGKTVEDVCRKWNKWFDEECNKSLSRMITFLIAKGKIPAKKPRGKKSTQTNQTN